MFWGSVIDLGEHQFEALCDLADVVDIPANCDGVYVDVHRPHTILYLSIGETLLPVSLQGVMNDGPGCHAAAAAPTGKSMAISWLVVISELLPVYSHSVKLFPLSVELNRTGDLDFLRRNVIIRCTWTITNVLRRQFGQAPTVSNQ